MMAQPVCRSGKLRAVKVERQMEARVKARGASPSVGPQARCLSRYWLSRCPCGPALRVCRIVVLATQTPATRVLNGPQPKRACVIIPSGCCSGAGVSACADETRAGDCNSDQSQHCFLPLICASCRLDTRNPRGAKGRSPGAIGRQTCGLQHKASRLVAHSAQKKALQMYLYSPPTADSWEGRDLGEAISATMGSAGAIAVRS